MKLDLNSIGLGPEGFVKPEIKFLQKLDSLVEKYFKVRKDVTFYADAMFISKKVLNKRLKQTGNITLSQLIRTRVMQEALFLINASTMSMKEICYELGLSDPSHFIRYFKKELNTPPGVGRKELSKTMIK